MFCENIGPENAHIKYNINIAYVLLQLYFIEHIFFKYSYLRKFCIDLLYPGIHTII